MKNKIIAFVVLIVVLAIGFYSFSNKKKDDVAQTKDIKIGVLLPLTGDGGTSGEKMYQGIQLASKEFPSNVKLITEDTHSKVADAVSGAHKLVDIDKVDFIVGPYITDEVIAIAPIAKAKNIVLFTGTFCDDSLKNLTNVFCGYPNSDKQLATVISEIKKNNIKTMALVDTNDTFGLSSRDSMKNLSSTVGYNVVSDELIQTDAKDLKVNASKVINSKADAVFIATGNTAQAFTLMKSLYEQKYKGMRITFIDVDTKFLKEFGSSADGTYAPGIAPNNFSESYKNKYKSAYNKEANDYLPAVGYDIARLSLGAYLKNNKDDLVSSAISYDYKDSAIGQFKYLNDRTVLFDMQLWKAENGNYVPVK